MNRVMNGLVLAVALVLLAGPALAADKPNIVVIMGDDIGMVQPRRLPPGDDGREDAEPRQARREGMRFTDYYAEASCTAGGANFITGELPIRTGMTTVGQAGRQDRDTAQAVTIATALKAMRYATGQFGKTTSAISTSFCQPFTASTVLRYLYPPQCDGGSGASRLPQELLNGVGPRNMVHSWASDKDDRGDAALGQDRQAEDRGCGDALSQADGDGGRRDSRPPSSSWRRRRRTASRSSSGSTRPACTSSRTSLRNTKRSQFEEWLDHSRSRHGADRR